LKEFSKYILDEFGRLIVAKGFMRKRRGLFFRRLNDEMTAALSLQTRSYGGSYVDITPYYQVYWEPVEQIFCLGTGRQYRYLDQPTLSQIRIVVSENGLGASLFWKEVAEPAKLEGLVEKFCSDFERETAALADPAKILEFFCSELKYGGGRLEQYLSVLVWKKRSLSLDNELVEVDKELKTRPNVIAFPGFLQKLRESSELTSLLKRAYD